MGFIIQLNLRPGSLCIFLRARSGAMGGNWWVGGLQLKGCAAVNSCKSHPSTSGFPVFFLESIGNLQDFACSRLIFYASEEISRQTWGKKHSLRVVKDVDAGIFWTISLKNMRVVKFGSWNPKYLAETQLAEDAEFSSHHSGWASQTSFHWKERMTQ